MMFRGRFSDSPQTVFRLSCPTSAFSDLFAKWCPVWKAFLLVTHRQCLFGPCFFVCFHISGIDKNLREGASLGIFQVLLWILVQMFIMALRCKVITKLHDTQTDTQMYEALWVLIGSPMGISCGRDFSVICKHIRSLKMEKCLKC